MDAVAHQKIGISHEMILDVTHTALKCSPCYKSSVALHFKSWMLHYLVFPQFLQQGMLVFLWLQLSSQRWYGQTRDKKNVTQQFVTIGLGFHDNTR